MTELSWDYYQRSEFASLRGRTAGTAGTAGAAGTNQAIGEDDAFTQVTLSWRKVHSSDGCLVVTDREACRALPDVPAKDDALPKQQAELLHRLEAWLRTTESKTTPTGAATPTDVAAPTGVEPKDGERVLGLYPLYETLASQRHELKLLTKSVRQTQELLAGSIEESAAAVALLQREHRDQPDIERKAVKPFLSSLVEMDESLERAAAAVRIMQERLAELLGPSVERSAAAWCGRLSFWGRFWKRRTVRDLTEGIIREQQAEAERIFAPFREGFEMLRRRMDDVLKKHAIRRLDPRGEPLNPETMRVIAVVESQNVPSGYVVDVVRPGYLWRGKPIRFADVRAAR